MEYIKEYIPEEYIEKSYREGAMKLLGKPEVGKYLEKKSGCCLTKCGNW